MSLLNSPALRRQIRCPQQIAFLKFWERSRGQHSIPTLDLLDVATIRPIAAKLMLCQVIREHDEVRFLIKFHGVQFEQAHGKRCVGQYVDDAVAPSLREKAVSMYRLVVTSQEPIFSSTPMRYGDGPTVNYERLLLPFTKAGTAVDHICCIITMFTEENGFNFDIAAKGHPIYDA